MNSWRERGEYWAACAVIGLARRAPRAWFRWILAGFSQLYFRASARRRRTTLSNLAIAFPEKNAMERAQLARRCYRHFSHMAADSLFLISGRWSAEDFLARVDYETALARYRKETAEAPGGVIQISGHLGNWEFLFHLGALLGFPSVGIVRRTANPLIEERIVSPARHRFGSRVVYKKEAVRAMARELANGGTVSMLIDQKTSHRFGAPVAFFGKETLAVRTPAALQSRFGARVIPTALFREDDGRYTLHVGEPIDWIEDERPKDAQIDAMTQRHQSAIEAMIRCRPEQWFWMHNRWRLER